MQPVAGTLGRGVAASRDECRELHADDTPVPGLAPGKGKTKTGRLWTYVRDDRPWEINFRPPCGSPTRRIAKANM